MTQRLFPQIDTSLPAPTRPISFVCVKFCEEYDYNLATSSVVQDSLNQLIVVDNSQNVHFPTLGAALLAGIAQARHELICLVHEDVVLQDGWQARFEASLTALEAHDPDWGLLGAVGWRQGTDGPIGHWSDPKRPVPINSFAKSAPWQPIDRLDEQLLILRWSLPLRPDPQLPSIHNIGPDLTAGLARLERAAYVIDAPTIHKYADETGTPIQERTASAKIRDRRSLTYKADRAVSDAYLAHKLGQSTPAPDPLAGLSEAQRMTLSRPVVLVGRGGGGTRLISTLAQDCGLFIGNDVNVSGDCMDLVPALYRGVLRCHRYDDPWSLAAVPDDILGAVVMMLEQAGWPDRWGFKLPEAVLLLPVLQRLFPRARYMHFHRAPLQTVFRRTHMTARADNHIGRTTLCAAYDYMGRDRALILTDSDAIRMAVTTRHQNDLIAAHRPRVAPKRWSEIRFEDTVRDPMTALRRFSTVAGSRIATRRITKQVDPDRGASDLSRFSSQEIETVLDLLGLEPSDLPT